MFTVMIVEDEPHLLQFLKKKLEASEEFTLKSACATPEEAIAAFSANPVDVLFLDIEMPRMNGIQLAEQLLRQKEDLRIVFTTAYDHYALDAFQVEAIDYLLKPITDPDIQRVLRRLKKSLPSMQSNRLPSTNIPSVRCFGCFEVRNHDQQLVRWPTRKAEELFAYFVAHPNRHVSKWELLEQFWSDLNEDRGLHHLYSTIYRVKQVLKALPSSPTIQKVNEGYVLDLSTDLSDLGSFLAYGRRSIDGAELPTEEELHLYALYAKPLFGDKGYIWSLSVEENADYFHAKLCERLLDYYCEQQQFEEADRTIRQYVKQHLEDEAMMLRWLKRLNSFSEYESHAAAFRSWCNNRLIEAELPPLP